jgi:RNA polymerase sigma-70 factor (ECF subfamily)
MAASDSGSGSAREGFTTTRWSLVAAASGRESPQAREALASLCEAYWPPVYAFLRRHGTEHDQALDLTQGFFAVLIEKNYVGDARRDRGRFRTFLLAAVKHYVSNERDREQALKRGGGKPLVSLDSREEGDAAFLLPSHDETPERIFDRRWARTLLDASLRRLREEMGRSPGIQRFDRLLPYLTGDSEEGYREAAASIGISESAVKVAVHRLRRRFRDVLRAEVAETVGDPADVDAELSHLLKVLGS